MKYACFYNLKKNQSYLSCHQIILFVWEMFLHLLSVLVVYFALEAIIHVKQLAYYWVNTILRKQLGLNPCYQKIKITITRNTGTVIMNLCSHF